MNNKEVYDPDDESRCPRTHAIAMLLQYRSDPSNINAASLIDGIARMNREGKTRTTKKLYKSGMALTGLDDGGVIVLFPDHPSAALVEVSFSRKTVRKMLKLGKAAIDNG